MSDTPAPAGAAPAPETAATGTDGPSGDAGGDQNDGLTPAARELVAEAKAREAKEAREAKAAAKKPARAAPVTPAAPDRDADAGDDGENATDGGENATEDNAGDAEGEDDGESDGKIRLELKVRGETEAYEFDPNDPKDVQRLRTDLQKARAADQSMRRAADIEKKARGLVDRLRQSPFDVLTHPSLGLSKDQVADAAEKFLYRNRVMSPEQRAALDEKDELERYRSADQEAQERAEAEAREQDKEVLRQRFQREIIGAMEQHDVPKNDWTVRRVAHYMKLARTKGLKNIGPSEVMPLVQKDWMGAQRQLLSNLSGDKLIELLGKDVADKVRRADLARVQSRQPVSQQQPGRVAAQPQQSSAPKYGSTEEMRDALERRSR